MFKDIINSLIKIFNEDAYLNLTINSVLNARNYNEHEKKIYVKVTSGVVENKLLIDKLLSSLISGKRVKPFIKNALRTAIYMISFMDIANHYVVNEIVKIVKKEDYKASKFANAILRKYISDDVYLKELANIEKLDRLERLSILYSINIDLVKLLDSQYENVESILKQCNKIYNCYRINTLKTTIEELKQTLEESNIEYDINNVTLKTKDSLIHHKLFLEGKIVAQDASSIKVGLHANPCPNSNVLDACSAPGSKTMHMAAIMNNTGHILSCDIYEHKLELINESARRLGVTNIKTCLKDASSESYNELFDLVLVDAPCSGLGVIRHKSDLKYKMTLEKIMNINILQRKILDNCANYVLPKGRLVYSTCTINKNENEYLIYDFIKRHPNFKLKEEVVIVQNENNSEDGFYIASLERI